MVSEIDVVCDNISQYVATLDVKAFEVKTRCLLEFASFVSQVAMAIVRVVYCPRVRFAAKCARFRSNQIPRCCCRCFGWRWAVLLCCSRWSGMLCYWRRGGNVLLPFLGGSWITSHLPPSSPDPSRRRLRLTLPARKACQSPSPPTFPLPAKFSRAAPFSRQTRLGCESNKHSIS